MDTRSTVSLFKNCAPSITMHCNNQCSQHLAPAPQHMTSHNTRPLQIRHNLAHSLASCTTALKSVVCYVKCEENRYVRPSVCPCARSTTAARCVRRTKHNIIRLHETAESELANSGGPGSEGTRTAFSFSRFSSEQTGWLRCYTS